MPPPPPPPAEQAVERTITEDRLCRECFAPEVECIINEMISIDVRFSAPAATTPCRILPCATPACSLCTARIAFCQHSL